MNIRRALARLAVPWAASGPMAGSLLVVGLAGVAISCNSGSNTPALTITSQPAAQTAVDGHTATFTVVATGQNPVAYQWQRNGQAINGATSASYTTPATVYATDNNAQFTVVVSDAGNRSVTSQAAKLTVTPVAPTVTALTDQTVAEGAQATFSATGSGTAPITYKWQRAGQDIANATQASYTTAAVSYAADNNVQYTVVVTNGAGQTTSSSAKLYVSATATQITAGPQNATVVDGQSATFSVTATGSTPLSYQWKKNNHAISGATGSSYTLPAAVYASDNAAQFTVDVTNAAQQTVTSAAATLTVTPIAPAISAGPQSVTVNDLQPASFTVTATGTAPLSYAWYRNGSVVNGATGATLSIPAVAWGQDNNATYHVIVTNGANQAVTSGDATLTVTPVRAALTGPANVTATDGQTASFSVTATGTAPFSYQWKRAGVALTGATSATYSTAALVYASDNGASFSVDVTNGAGQVTASNAATLTVTPKVTQLTGPAAATVTDGQTASFSVTATGTGPFTYQWKRAGVAITGATSASYTTAATVYASDNNASFTVDVTNGASQVTTSSAAVLTVTPIAPSITTGPIAQSVNEGNSVSFTVAATGTAPLSYQWYENGTAVTGATSATLTLPAPTVAADNGAQISVKVTNGAGQTVTSTPVLLTVTAVPVAPSFTSQPNAAVNVAAGQPLTLTVAVSGTSPFTYAWTKDGNPVGTDAATYSVASAAAGDAGTYKVTVTNSVTSVTSHDIVVTVSQGVSIATQPQSQTVVPPAGATFSVTLNGAVSPTYRWQLNGTDITGATGSSYTVAATDLYAFPPSKTYTYRVIVTDGSTTLTSDDATLKVSVPSPTYPGFGDPQPVPSRAITVLPSFHQEPTAYPNGSFRFGYDEALKNPIWTAYLNFRMTGAYDNGSRTFTPDTRLQSPQVTDNDMGTHGSSLTNAFFLSNGNGYDRGHMVTLSDLSYHYDCVQFGDGQYASDDSCRMDNVVPQVSYFNQKLWLKLEGAMCGLKSGGGLNSVSPDGRAWIYTGTIYAGSNSTKAVTYWVPTSGSDGFYTANPATAPAGVPAIGIPTATYKIAFMAPKAGQTYPQVVAWVSSNRAYTTTETNGDVWKYVTSLARLEELTNLDFTPNLTHDAALAAWKASVDVRGMGSDFEKSSGPNVHMIKPSWDLIPLTTVPGQTGETVTAGTSVSFLAAATPNVAGGTVNPTTDCTWTFGDGGTATGLSASYSYATAGTYTVTFSAKDSNNVTNSITRTVTVVAPVGNAAPTTTPATLPDVAATVGQAIPAQTFTVADDTTPAASLTVTATSGNPTLIANGGLLVTNNAGSVSIAFTPEAGQTGTAVITVTITDGDAASTVKTFNFSVNANNPPTFNPATLPDVTTLVDTAKQVSFTIADDLTAAGTIGLTAVSGNQTVLPDAGIAISNVAGAVTLTLTPAAGQTGSAVITVTATDESGLSTVKTFTLTVTPPTGASLSETFETSNPSTKTGYGSADVTFPSGVWTVNDALIGTTSGSDRFNGARSIRARNQSTNPSRLTMKFDFPSGARTVTVLHASYGTDGPATWALYYSKDQGATWTKAGSDVTTNSTTLTPATFTINEMGNIRFDIRRTDAVVSTSYPRICFDDFQIAGY